MTNSKEKESYTTNIPMHFKRPLIMRTSIKFKNIGPITKVKYL